MRICLQKSTGLFIEAQGNPRPGTLIQNAVKNGFKENDLEERESTEAELASIINAQFPNKGNLAEMLSAKSTELALAALKAEGKVDADGKVVK